MEGKRGWRAEGAGLSFAARGSWPPPAAPSMADGHVDVAGLRLRSGRLVLGRHGDSARQSENGDAADRPVLRCGELPPQSRPAASTASSPPPPAAPAGWQQRGSGGSDGASPSHSSELETCRSLESFHSLATTAQFTAFESMLPRSESDLSSLALEEVTALADEAAALQRRLCQTLRLARAKMWREGGVGSFLPPAAAEAGATAPAGPSGLVARAGGLLSDAVLLALAVLEVMLIRAAAAVEAATCGAVRLRGAARLAPELAARVLCMLFVTLELLVAQLRGWLPDLF